MIDFAKGPILLRERSSVIVLIRVSNLKNKSAASQLRTKPKLFSLLCQDFSLHKFVACVT